MGELDCVRTFMSLTVFGLIKVYDYIPTRLPVVSTCFRTYPKP